MYECKNILVDLRDCNVTLNFVKLSTNKVVHFLARHICSMTGCVWKMGNVYPESFHVLSNNSKF